MGRNEQEGERRLVQKNVVYLEQFARKPRSQEWNLVYAADLQMIPLFLSWSYFLP